MEQIGRGIFLLRDDMLAWNVDGSSSHRYEDISWIRIWEVETGQRRGRCCYSDCPMPAQIGGHIWICRHGVFIAPICRACNDAQNPRRMQNSQSTLRAGSIVVMSEYTEDMASAQRRIVEKIIRRCSGCNCDISDQPENHTQCPQCYRGQQQQRWSRRRCRRRCQGCGKNISDRPENHTFCWQCYRGWNDQPWCQDYS